MKTHSGFHNLFLLFNRLVAYVINILIVSAIVGVIVWFISSLYHMVTY